MRVLFSYPCFENLGVQMLSAMLKQHGHQTELLFDPRLFDDLFLESRTMGSLFSYFEELLHQTVRFQPDLVCFTTLTDNYRYQLGLARAIKRIMPKVPIAFGGIHTTSVPDRVLAQDCVDFVCVGEGEHPLLELVQHLEAGASDFPIPNIWYKKDGRVIANPLRPLIEDLDLLPRPDKELFLKQAPYAKGEYNAMALRGCVYHCTFCHHALEKPLYKGLGTYIRRRSVDNFIAELRDSVQLYNWKTIKIWDEIFTFDKKWLAEFAERYRAEVNRPFWCFLHPNFADAEVVRLLQYAGCWQVDMGVQTLDLQVKAAVGRVEALDTVSAAIRRCREAGIQVVVDHMLSLPGQQPEDLEQTFKFYLENTPSHINTYWLRYFPRTPIVEYSESLGILNKEEITEIEEGAGSKSFTQGGTRPRKDMESLQTALAFQPILPKPVTRWLAKRRYLDRFPSIRASGHVLSRMVHWNPRRDVGGRRYAKHYVYYIAKRIWEWITLRRIHQVKLSQAVGRTVPGGTGD